MSENYSPSATAPSNFGNSGVAEMAKGVAEQARDVAGQGQDVAGQAKEQGAQLGHSVVEGSKHVADVAKDQAANAAQEAAQQARGLLSQAQSELSEQAVAQQQRTAAKLRELSTELRSMTDNGSGDGPAADLVKQAASHTGNLAEWLDGRDPGQLVDEVRRFARQRPGTFLALAAGAGVLAGRLTRGVTADVGSSAGAAGPTGAASSSGAPTGVTSATATNGPRSVEDTAVLTPEQYGGPITGPGALGGPAPVPSFSVPPVSDNDGSRS